MVSLLMRRRSHLFGSCILARRLQRALLQGAILTGHYTRAWMWPFAVEDDQDARSAHLSLHLCVHFLTKQQQLLLLWWFATEKDVRNSNLGSRVNTRGLVLARLCRLNSAGMVDKQFTPPANIQTLYPFRSCSEDMYRPKDATVCRPRASLLF
jgi:hypothetical protein